MGLTTFKSLNNQYFCKLHINILKLLCIWQTWTFFHQLANKYSHYQVLCFLLPARLGFGSFTYLNTQLSESFIAAIRKGIPLSTQSPLRLPLGRGRGRGSCRAHATSTPPTPSASRLHIKPLPENLLKNRVALVRNIF